MSKQQLQQITNKVASRGSVYNGGALPFGPASSGLVSAAAAKAAGGLPIEGGVNYSTNQPSPTTPLTDGGQL